MIHSYVLNDRDSAQLNSSIYRLYNKLTATRYVTNRSLEVLTQEAIQAIDSANFQPKWFLTIHYIDQLAKYSQAEKTYDLYDRRFLFIFDALYRYSFNEETYLTEEAIATFTKLLAEQSAVSDSPWPRLFQIHTKHLEPRQVENIYDAFSNVEGEISYSFALLYSYISLLNGKEAQALSLLSVQRHQLIELEIYPHFHLLKERQRWITIKQWFDTLFIKQRQTFGSLQPIWEEYKAVHAKTAEDQDGVWKRWLVTPNFQRFLQLSQHLTKEEKQLRITHLLNTLENRLYQTESVRAYEQLLLYAQEYEQAQEHFLLNEFDPVKIRPEKKALLEAMKKERPDLAIPIYHQLIIRLVERKSRVHYQHAALAVSQLKHLYTTLDAVEKFEPFLIRLKKQYRTYKAFIEELKSFEL
ncbi:hypothetical protein [Halalkalibacter hemicellulosilyticus]|uniref:Uncharacterized protein n=1 Tax=Halalkalibacter hemicellulosilyticusJCM 9152 TaxID=1236971 RepID=W4QGF9_9BACI|nr:hypothetical protein [Halalkalibacter hemicellulosilyticus]GAE31200.1 hypothetical protein JCM9152_2653 [Halalkalibacter hemicellulosilyticusJCM 9152]